MRNFFLFIAPMLFAAVVLYSCGRPQTSYVNDAAYQERIFVVNIIPGDQLLNEYLDYHQQIWPEVEAGFKKAGYKDIVLYRYDHLLVMTITVPQGANLDSMSRLAESYSPRCAAWNKLMATYQTGVPGAPKGATWVEMKSFYKYGN